MSAGFDAVPGALWPGATWPGEPPAATPPVFTYPAYWTVEWVQAETQVTVTGPGVTVTIAPAGPLAATGSVAGIGVTVSATPVPANAYVTVTGPPAASGPLAAAVAPGTLPAGVPGTFQPPDAEVIYPAAAAVLQPSS